MILMSLRPFTKAHTHASRSDGGGDTCKLSLLEALDQCYAGEHIYATQVLLFHPMWAKEKWLVFVLKSFQLVHFIVSFVIASFLTND